MLKLAENSANYIKGIEEVLISLEEAKKEIGKYRGN